jgi:hypothetical protein
MPAPKGNKNAQTAWYTGTPEEKVYLSVRVPVAFRDRAKAVFKAEETVSEFLIEAIKLLIKERSQP